MRCEISKKINIEESELRKKSERVLKNILYDYAGFDILTLDTFTHRIVRTFALDLKLPKSFEVVVEQDEILKELIQIIINKVGIEKGDDHILIKTFIKLIMKTKKRLKD